MKLLSNIISTARRGKLTARRGLMLAAVAAAIIGVGVFQVSTAHADVFFPASTADCNNNAVVHCGVTSTAQIKSRYARTASVRNIYAGFGISKSDVEAISNTDSNGTGTYTVAGYVTKTNNVFVDGFADPVATDAVTAGRQNIAGSTKVVTNDTTYYKRAPNVSFRSNSIPAFVVMKGGVFQYAIISTCGNPVTATPKKPNYTIAKTVNEATVKPGTTVTYTIDVTSTGEVPAVNVMAKDVLPDNVTYVDNTLTQNGVKVRNDNDFFAAGVRIASLDPGKVVHFKFQAVVGATDTASICTDERLTNTATITSVDLPTKNDTAIVDKKCLPKPAYACINLSATRVGSSNQYKFAVTASATNGAEIVNYTYDFNDGPVLKTAATNNVAHTYTKPGTYHTRVTANVLVEGKTIAVTSAACAKTITIAQPPVPVYTCDKLTATQSSRAQFAYTTATTATNGASVISYVYNFGDSTAPVTVPAGNNSVQHTYANPGTYTTAVNVNFSVGGTTKTVSSAQCQAVVTVAPQPSAECTSLVPTLGANRSVSVTANYVAQNGATFKAASFDFGDSTSVVTGSSAVASHTYAADGTFTIKATLSFNGVTAPASICQTVVSFDTPQPVYSCDAFDITKSNDRDDRSVTVAAFKTTATNGAVFNSADIKWGDDTSDNGVKTVVGQTHKYGQAGTYVITALAHFTVNGVDVTAGGEHCTKTVVFAPTPVIPPVVPPVPPVTPAALAAPTTLVNVGPGQVIGLFAAVTTVSTFAYSKFMGRRLSSME